MDAIRRILVAFSLVVSMMPIGWAVSTPVMQASSASAGPRHDTSTDLREQDPHGLPVRLRVHALVPEKVQLSDPSERTVRARVLAIDKAINQIRVQTEEGQRLMLFLEPASLARLQVGAPCLLQVTNGSTRETSQPPGHEEVLW
jgi:hypothetical protein